MSLKDLLMDDLKVAMREKDTIRKSVVTMLRAAVKQIEVDQRIELDDDAIIDIIAKQIKQKNNAIVEFQNGNRQDLVDLTEKEILKSLKGLLKKKIVEYDEENGELILFLVPNLN